MGQVEVTVVTECQSESESPRSPLKCRFMALLEIYILIETWRMWSWEGEATSEFCLGNRTLSSFFPLFLWSRGTLMGGT